MQADRVVENLRGMDDLDFTGWNSADSDGVFAHHHTEDVLVDWKGPPFTHGIVEHFEAMKAYVESAGGTHPLITARRPCVERPRRPSLPSAARWVSARDLLDVHLRAAWRQDGHGPAVGAVLDTLLGLDEVARPEAP